MKNNKKRKGDMEELSDTVNMRAFRVTRDRLKIKAAKRGLSMQDLMEELSKKE